MAVCRLGLLLVLFGATICLAVNLPLPYPKVMIPGLGEVEGSKLFDSTINKRPIYSYRGIPFGKPPVGNLRFQPPVAVDPWEPEVLNARDFGTICIQTGSFKKKNGEIVEQPKGFWDYVYSPEKFLDYLDPKLDIPGTIIDILNKIKPKKDEDCLNLSVYTPVYGDAAIDAKLPVMVWFHGGAFLDGSSVIYWPQHLLDHDMILVVPHYRLGPLGFLSLQTDEIPGNAGMFDQILAMEWVQKNIAAFGGDPNQVTAAGESAGAASVSLHSISPLSKGLFNRIIAESGSGIAEWAIDRDPVYNTHGIGRLVDCDPESSNFVQCLRDVNPYVLTQAYKYEWKPSEMKKGRTGFGGCSPVVQTNPNGPKFLDKMPIEYWREENFEPVPALYGANKHEGSYIMAIVYNGYILANDLLYDQYFLKYDAVRVFLDLFLIEDPAYLLHDALEYEYVGIENLGNITAMIPGMVDFGGDTFLKGPSYENMKLHAKLSKTGNSYWYAFNFFECATLWPFIGSLTVPFPGGVTHANDLIFIFNIPIISDLLTESEKKLAREMSNIWYNYVAFGETQPADHIVEGVPADWKPYNAEDNTYVRFDKENLLLVDYPKTEYTISRDERFSLVPWTRPDYCWYDNLPFPIPPLP